MTLPTRTTPVKPNPGHMASTSAATDDRSTFGASAEGIPPYPGAKNGHGVYQAIVNQLPLHARYVGSTYRRRDELKRMARRWLRRLDSLPQDERQYLLTALCEHWHLCPSSHVALNAARSTGGATDPHATQAHELAARG